MHQEEGLSYRKHKLANLGSINITKFQNFELLEYWFSMSIECAF